MTLLRKTPHLELENYKNLIQVNENYLASCEKEKKDALYRYESSQLSYEVIRVKLPYLENEIKSTKKLIEKYKAKIDELKLLIG